MALLEFIPGTHDLHLSFRSGRSHRDLTLWGRDILMTTGRPFSGSVRWHLELAYGGIDLRPQATGAPFLGQERTVDELWRELFSDPSQWWDNRSEKGKAKYPDFTHKTTQDALWVQSKSTPTWVGAELAAMGPGRVQLNIFAWNKRLVKHVKAREYQQVMDLFQQIQREGIKPDKFTFVPVLNACASLRALDKGRHIHTLIVQSGYEYDAFVGSSLVNMYAKCGTIEDSWKVFNKMPTHDVVTWTTLILGYAKCGQGKQALQLFGQMQQERVEPNRFTFVAVLNACASVAALEEGKKIHQQINESGCESDIFVGSSLVDMYAKCGSVEDATKVFNKMPSRNVVTWNTMILACAKYDRGKEALKLYQQMQNEGLQPNTVTFVGVLNACASLAALEAGMHVHEQIIHCSCESNIFVGNSLVDMYVKCGSIQDAWKVFVKMPTCDVFTWSIIIQGYVKCGQGEKALDLFHEMQWDGVEPDPVTFVAVLNACASLRALEEGRRVHGQIIQRGCKLDVYVGSSLVDMYAKCGSIDDAFRVFNEMPQRDAVTWGSMILGFVNCGQGKKALELSQCMQEDGVEPNRFTILAVLKACASVASLEEGRRVHEEIIEGGWESDLFVGSSLVDMYAKCGSIEDSWTVFKKMPTRDAVAWGTMILACVKCGQWQEVMELFQQMQKEGLKPQPAVFVGMLNMCASLGALEEGRFVHEQVISSGWESDITIGNSLVDMYSKCSRMEDAWKVFIQMPRRDVVGWSSLIGGYVKCGEAQKALDLSQQMYVEGVNPNSFTFVAMLSACGNLAALEEGRRVHGHIIEHESESDVFVATSLIDMYAKCGSIEEARRVFDNMSLCDVVLWNAMILGHVRCRQWQQALGLSQQMQVQGLRPNPITYMALLSACAGLGILEEGKHVHEQVIQSGFGSDFYVSCSLIDMYAKCGSIEDAWSVFNKMPRRDIISWKAMVRGYVNSGQKHKALKLYQQMIQQGLESEPVEIPTADSSIPSLAALEVYQQMNQEGMESEAVEVLSTGSIEPPLPDGRQIYQRLI